MNGSKHPQASGCGRRRTTASRSRRSGSIVAAGAALAFGTGVTVSGGSVAVGANPSGFEEPQKGWRKREWRREMAKRKRQIIDTKVSDMQYDRQIRATGSNMIVLDPPLPTHVEWGQNPATLSVEWFHSWITNDGGSSVAAYMSTQVRAHWFPSVARGLPKGAPVSLQEYGVVAGPAMAERFAAARRTAGELRHRMGWYGRGIEDHPEREQESARVYQKFMQEALHARLGRMDTEEKAIAFVEEHGGNWAEWEWDTDEYLERQTKFVDKRWRRIVERAIKVQPDAFALIPDPVLLIDGKYLVTQNTVRRQGGANAVARTFQVASWLVAREAAKLPQAEYDWEAARWGNEARSKRGQVRELAQPFPRPADGKMHVEWFYTYWASGRAARSSSGMCPCAISSTYLRTRRKSSLAANSVNVTATMDLGSTPSASRAAIRPARTAVLPEPAPASTSSDRAWSEIAFRRALSSARSLGSRAIREPPISGPPPRGGRLQLPPSGSGTWPPHWQEAQKRDRCNSRRCRARERRRRRRDWPERLAGRTRLREASLGDRRARGADRRAGSEATHRLRAPRDGYFGGCGRARAHEVAGPAKRFDGLVICRRGADGDNLRSLRRLFHDLDDFAIEPRRGRSRTGDPAHRSAARKTVQQRAPARREFRYPDDVDRSKDRRGVFESLVRRSREVARPLHR